MCALLLAGCGSYRSVPKVWDPQAYRLVAVKDLRAPGAAGLAAGQLIKAPAYFWEFLLYDPAMGRNYLTMLRHPLTWPQLEWFSVYGTPEMREFFDQMAMDQDQRRAHKLERLDHILIYGELVSMGGGLLYVRVHRLQKLEED